MTYKICVKFPGKPEALRHHQTRRRASSRATHHLDKPGEHKVKWYVDGEKVGTYRFDVT